MSELFVLFSCVFLSLLGIIGYLLYYTQSLVRRTDTEIQKAFDSLLALVNRQAALTAANMQKVRQKASESAPPVDSEELARARKRAEDDRMLDEIARATVLTPEQEKFLESHNRNGV